MLAAVSSPTRDSRGTYKRICMLREESAYAGVTYFSFCSLQMQQDYEQVAQEQAMAAAAIVATAEDGTIADTASAVNVAADAAE